MASKSVEAIRAAHESFNRPDYGGMVRNLANGLSFQVKTRIATRSFPPKHKSRVRNLPAMHQ